MKRAVLLLALASSAALGQGAPPQAAAADLSSVVPSTRSVGTGTTATSGLSGGGALSGNLTLSCPDATDTAQGCVGTSASTWAGKKTFNGGALMAADLQITQGLKLTFDGATAAKYLSSDGTTLTLTGIAFSTPGLTSTGVSKFTGDVTSCNASGTVCIGKRASSTDGAIWFNQSGTLDHTTCSMRGDTSGNTIINAASGNIQFAIGGTGRGGLGATGKWSIGASGDSIGQMNTGTATIDFASISAGACGTDTTVTVTGATTTAACQLGVPNGSMNAAGSMFMCYVSSADTAKVRHCCINGTCDPASGSFRVWTINP